MGCTVLIVDDHAPFRSVARALLEAAGFEIVGEAADGASAIEAVAKLRPAIVLLDVQLPDLDGFTVADRIADDGASSRVILTSSRGVASFRGPLAANPKLSFMAKSDLSGEALRALVAGR